MRSLPFIEESWVAIQLVANGYDIWCQNSNRCLIQFRDMYIHHYSAIPINSRFTEHGVKESGYISLGRICEHNRSILAIACGCLIPNALAKRREGVTLDEEDDSKPKQLQGKMKTKYLLREVADHCVKIKILKDSHTNDIAYCSKRKSIYNPLTNPSKQLKKEQIGKRVAKIIARCNNNPTANT